MHPSAGTSGGSVEKSPERVPPWLLTGDPTDLLSTSEFRRAISEHRGRSIGTGAWSGWIGASRIDWDANRPGYLPAPAHTEPCPNGGVYRWWTRQQVAQWLSTPIAMGGPRKPRYAPTPAAVRAALGRHGEHPSAVARDLTVPLRTAQRLIEQYRRR